MKKQSLRNILGASLLAAMLAVASSAQAITFDITSDHATGAGGLGTAPFGTVTLTQNGANVDVTVDLVAGYLFVRTGSADFQNFKFNGVGVALGDITVDPVAGLGLVAATGAFNGDGTGEFDFGINASLRGNGAGNGFADDIVFHVANATIADLTQPNNLGILFVADLYSTATGNTGPGDVTVPGVPDGGSTLVLLGSALASLSFFARRRKV